MSAKLTMLIWESSLAPHVKPLASMLALFAQDDGTSIYPSIGRLARLLGHSRRTVQRQLGELLAAEVLALVTPRTGGRQRTTEYRFRLERLTGAGKGDTGVTVSETVTPVTRKGDTGVTRSVRDSKEYVPPRTPPLRGGAHALPTKATTTARAELRGTPVTRSEIRWATTTLSSWRQIHRAACPHTPPCRSQYVCLGHLIEDRRLDLQTGSLDARRAGRGPG